MKVRIISPAEFDRHEAEVRFVSTIDGRRVGVTLTTYALFIAGEALGIASGGDPIVRYAACGKLLEAVLAKIATDIGETRQTYLIDHNAVLSVTGRSGIGNDQVPNRWPA